MTLKSIVAVAVFMTLLAASPGRAQIADNEPDFQKLAAALKANDAERQSAVATCIRQGIGENPAAAAQFMGVPVDKAAQAWCTRITNGIADGKLTLSDIKALNEGAVTPNARDVLTVASGGK